MAVPRLSRSLVPPVHLLRASLDRHTAVEVAAEATVVAAEATVVAEDVVEEDMAETTTVATVAEDTVVVATVAEEVAVVAVATAVVAVATVSIEPAGGGGYGGGY